MHPVTLTRLLVELGFIDRKGPCPACLKWPQLQHYKCESQAESTIETNSCAQDASDGPLRKTAMPPEVPIYWEEADRYDRLGLETDNYKVYWTCPEDSRTDACEDVNVCQDSYVLNPDWTIHQNAHVLAHWAGQEEPDPQNTALECHVPYKQWAEVWLPKLRGMVEEYQEEQDARARLGGPGVDCELDEIGLKCTRARREKMVDDPILGIFK